MSKTAPITNGECDEIYAMLPKSLVREYGYMALTAIIDAGRGEAPDHSFNTADEIAVYNAARVAIAIWMQA